MKDTWRKRFQRSGFTPVQMMMIEGLMKDASKEVEREYTQKSFLLMLAIPLNVLIADHWGEENPETKEKAEDFVKECMSLMDSYSNDGISYSELAEYVKEWSGVDFTAPWMEDIVRK